MAKTHFADGVCENCGNTGLAGEKCLMCGGILVGLDESATDYKEAGTEPETYPPQVLESGSETEDLIEE